MYHNITVIAISNYVFHDGQHFTYLRNLFEPKSWNRIIKYPLWEYDQEVILTFWFRVKTIYSDFVTFAIKVTVSDLHLILPIELIGK